MKQKHTVNYSLLHNQNLSFPMYSRLINMLKSAVYRFVFLWLSFVLHLYYTPFSMLNSIFLHLQQANLLTVIHS